MKEIGGYFELELPCYTGDYIFKDMTAVNSGRNALEYILSQLPVRPKRLFLPAYTCEAVLQPILRLGLPYSFYRIDQKFQIPIIPDLGDNEYIIVNNYFGIKDRYVRKLADRYREQMIVDNAQALYSSIETGIKAFYSPRKFLGVPDGGFAVTDRLLTSNLPASLSWEEAGYLLKRIDMGASSGYEDYRSHEKTIEYKVVSAMSRLTETIIRSVDHQSLIKKRRNNYCQLHNALASINRLELPQPDTFNCPMVYPFWTNNQNLRYELIRQKVYVAQYWPNVFEWCSAASMG